MTHTHVSPLRETYDAWLRESSAPASAADTAASRPGAATGYRASPPAVEYIAWGQGGGHPVITCEVPATFGALELEYAALRRGAGLLDGPNRGTIEVRGNDRVDFLNTMLTQEMGTLLPDQGCASFWLNRKGRIEADLVVLQDGDTVLLGVDVHQVDSTIASLEHFVFSEDVQLSDATGTTCRLGLHGPLAQVVLARAAGMDEEPGLEPWQAGTFQIGGVDVRALRQDLIGDIGIELFLPRGAAPDVWGALMNNTPPGDSDGGRVRPAGWYAWNIARIEAGTPMINIDFGETNLPNETGLLMERVSFTKGCYLGQEIVTRIHNLGNPKQQLVALVMEGEALPIAGAAVLPPGDDEDRKAVGVITSSTISPRRGAQPLAFAMVRGKNAEPGNQLRILAEGVEVSAEVIPLASLSAPGKPDET